MLIYTKHVLKQCLVLGSCYVIKLLLPGVTYRYGYGEGANTDSRNFSSKTWKVKSILLVLEDSCLFPSMEWAAKKSQPGAWPRKFICFSDLHKLFSIFQLTLNFQSATSKHTQNLNINDLGTACYFKFSTPSFYFISLGN